MKLLGSVVVLVLLWFCSQVSSLVQENVFHTECKRFFAFPPDGLPSSGEKGRFQQICQKQGKEFWFATLYDTFKKIPVFSAYEYKTYENKNRQDCWKIEPQLESFIESEDEMKTEEWIEKSRIFEGSPMGTKQAIKSDFRHSDYDRGHLYPVYHCKETAAIQATCTLTNAAPQDPSFNKGSWKSHERKVAKHLDTECVGKGLRAYIVTGVVPGPKEIGKGVNVPSHFWSAYCCVDPSNGPVFSGGVIGKNNNNKKQKLKDRTVTRLDDELTKLYGFPGFKVFGGKCFKDF